MLNTKILPRTFFQRDPITCARELVGCELVWNSCTGLIVETEAYTATGDEASHTFSRPSTRLFVAQHQAGTAYVYFNYGMYWLFNVLVKGGPEDGFVLIRALQPTRGLPAMRRRRFPKTDAATRPKPPEAVCSGPGKLTIAMGIGGQHHGIDLCLNPSMAFHGPAHPSIRRLSDIRIGISKSAHFPWRFLAAENPFVSARPTPSARIC
ncbi:MAG: DNA-3-methyladenine glycosylase [Chthoniobacter sp.]|uniref:DNA-3-methyladenine glycosylase n=1 Tax=Chthoniobacter sp. TaxID=2510640 RepID=UPI0032A7DE58